jgi:16S rRNA (adenine1518-N6/adenine1519-N6)-dimethyltransferase
MDIFLKKDIKNLLKSLNTEPKKSLGQNFLINKSILNKVLEAADIKPDDIILEIGPGFGVLTQELVKKAKKVIAIEKDEKICEVLKASLKDFKNIEIICEDILKILNSKFPARIGYVEGVAGGQIPNSYKVVANLPYYIASAVIRKFLETENPPKKMVLMVQKEVGQRICAASPKMNLLAVSAQFYADVKILFYVPKEYFWPKPKVDGAVIEIKPRINTDKKRINADLFFKVVKVGFSQPRKQLANNFKKALKLDNEEINSWLLKNNINPKARAENLTIEDWINLAKTLYQLEIVN